LPWQFNVKFAKLGLDANDPQYGKWVPDSMHSYIHRRYEDLKLAYNTEWREWFTRQDIEHNSATLEVFLQEMRSKYAQYYIEQH
jgi:hypothetical protein